MSIDITVWPVKLDSHIDVISASIVRTMFSRKAWFSLVHPHTLICANCIDPEGLMGSYAVGCALTLMLLLLLLGTFRGRIRP